MASKSAKKVVEEEPGSAEEVKKPVVKAKAKAKAKSKAKAKLKTEKKVSKKKKEEDEEGSENEGSDSGVEEKKQCAKKKKVQEEKGVSDLNPNILLDSGFFSERPDLLTEVKAWLEEKVKDEKFWEQPSIPTPGGKKKIPRLQRLVGEEGQTYTYSKTKAVAVGWSAPMMKLKEYLELKQGRKTNGALINLYREGGDHVSWHSDSEGDLTPGEPILSLSFFTTRRFSLRQKNKKSRVLDYDLTDGSLLVMSSATNKEFEHCIRKTKKEVGYRVNITFRSFTEASRAKEVS